MVEPDGCHGGVRVDIVALLDPRELVWSRACLTLSNWIYDGGCISVPSNGTFKDVGLVLGD